MNVGTNHNESNRRSILVVDDHELVLRGIRQILEQYFPELNIAVVSTGEEAVSHLKYRSVDLVSLDLELPDMSGFNLIDHVQTNHSASKILVNTVHDEIWTVKRLAERCVEGIIFKSASVQNYVDAVKAILNGGVFYDTGAKLLMRSIRNQSAKESNLSVREIEVLRLIADGLNTEEIAIRLDVKPSTIETHRRHLLDKFNVRNSAELVRQAISSGILSSME